MTFKPATQAHIRKIHSFTESAAGLSAKTVGQVSKYAQNFGAQLTARGEKSHHKGLDKNGKPVESYKPGILNKSLMAFSTVLDGVDQAGRSLLTSTTGAATTVVGHKYGAEAGKVTASIGGGVKNVGLVYIDAAGVSRKAVLKSVAKGMVVGKVRNKQTGQMEDIMVGGGDGGVYPSDQKVSQGSTAQSGVVASGGLQPPAYGSGTSQGQYPPDEKRGSYQ